MIRKIEFPPDLLEIAKEYEVYFQKLFTDIAESFMLKESAFGSVESSQISAQRLVSKPDIHEYLKQLEKDLNRIYQPVSTFCEVDQFNWLTIREVLNTCESYGWQIRGDEIGFRTGHIQTIQLVRGWDSVLLFRVPLIAKRMSFVELYKQGKIGRRFLRYLIGQSAGTTISRHQLVSILEELDNAHQ